MKTLRRISAVTILSLTLAVYAFAGHIETPGAPAPAPPATTGTTTTTIMATSETISASSSSILLMIVSLIYR